MQDRYASFIESQRQWLTREVTDKCLQDGDAQASLFVDDVGVGAGIAWRPPMKSGRCAAKHIFIAFHTQLELAIGRTVFANLQAKGIPCFWCSGQA